MSRRHEPEFALLDPKSLKVHEKTNPLRVVQVLMEVLRDGAFKDPVLVDAESGVVLDGHHRRFVALLLGLRKVPCWRIAYLSDEAVTVAPRRRKIPVSKEDVVRRGLSRKPYPQKTTRHHYQVPQMRPYSLRELRKDGQRDI